MRNTLTFILLIILPNWAHAQFFEYGQDPASVQWQSMESEHYQLIYPTGFEQKAHEVMHYLEHFYDENATQLGEKPRKVPVVLHTSSVRSNGFVIWGPRRMEFFMHPDVNGISQNWPLHLSIHEFRHIVQTEKLNRGITKVLTTILGEQGLGPAAGMLPFWFLEGDAVYAETSLTASGRGRLPSFEMEIKALLNSSEDLYSYRKAYLGSYKDHVPNYYQLGYQMVSFARDTFGNELWERALDFTGRNIFLIDPLYFFLKKNTGLNKKELYQKTMLHLRNHWEEKLQKRECSNENSYNLRESNVYTSYNFPHILPDSSVIAVKSGLDIIDRFVRVFPSGEEELIHIPGYLYSGRISVQDKKIIWDEMLPDLRWRNRSYSVIKEYNLETANSRTLTRKSRFSSPAFSSSGDTIVVIETGLNSDNYLTMLSTENGEILDRIPSPYNVQLQSPGWIDHSDQMFAIGVDINGKALLIYDRSDKVWQEAVPYHNYNISSPVSEGDYIYFNASYDGIDDIYAFHSEEKKLFKITSVKYGAFEPDVSDKLDILSYARYSADGYDIISDRIPEPIPYRIDQNSIMKEQTFFDYNDSPEYEQPLRRASTTFSEELDIKPYGRLEHLFHIHSWSPFYFDYRDPDIDNPRVSPGVTLLSQNLLSTAVTTLGYEYHDRDHYFHAGFSYKGWFPVFDLSFTYGGDPAAYAIEGRPLPEKPETNVSFDLLSYLPFTFTSDKWQTGLRASMQLSYNHSVFYYADEDAYKQGIFYTEPRLYFYRFQKTAYRDLQTRWGITLDLRRTSTPFEEEQLGDINTIKAGIYLPGIIRNQGIRLQAALQTQQTDRYLFGNKVSFPRGYEPANGENLRKVSADYLLPLLYPDLNLTFLAYIKRIRASIFTDYLYGENMYFITSGGREIKDRSYRSSGIELMMDFHPLATLAPFSAGIRLNYRHNDQDLNFEGIFSVDMGFF